MGFGENTNVILAVLLQIAELQQIWKCVKMSKLRAGTAIPNPYI
jgi:hypothetical protein